MLFFNVNKTNFIARCSGVRSWNTVLSAAGLTKREEGAVGGIRIIKRKGKASRPLLQISLDKC